MLSLKCSGPFKMSEKELGADSENIINTSQHIIVIDSNVLPCDRTTQEADSENAFYQGSVGSQVGTLLYRFHFFY